MDVGAAFVADEQPFEVVEPGEGALDDPAVAAEAGAVSVLRRAITGLMPRSRSSRRSAGVVVAAVGDDALGPPARAADLAARSAGRGRGAGSAGCMSWRLPPVSEKASGMPLASTRRWCFEPGRALINRARPRLGAPFFAWTWLESTTARDHSISPAARNRASSTSCSRSHTPACCHSSRRRQQVTPEPNRARPADASTGSPCATRTRSPAAPAGRAPLPARIPKTPLLHRQQRLNQLPQLVRDDPRRDSHRHPSQLDDGCRRRSSSGNGSLHYERSS